MKKISLIICLCISSCLAAQLKINELMSNNISAVMDDSYNYSMWVEVYNAGTELLNLGNYYLTDDLSEPTKFHLPSNNIMKGGYNAFWFERDDRSGHAPFKLKPNGGKLYLMNNTFQIVDSVIYPKQYRNVSYGRVSDGAEQWVYFSEYSWRCSNNNRQWATMQCAKPVFSIQGGFYAAAQIIRFETQGVDTIYYSIDGSEPTRQSTMYVPNTSITFHKTVCLRARAFAVGKLPSDIVSMTYFINERKFTLPVVSVITETKNLTDNTIGIYVQGTNGIAGNGYDSPCNWNQDWDRPANMELYDTTGIMRVNQELDISIAGGWSRAWNPKSLNFSPRNKFGNNKIDYDIFAATKPGHKYKDIRIRNSGNDYRGSLMRDAFMQSLIMHRTDIDYLAYEPAICFINGIYYGIENLRERSNKDYLYSNYGLDENEFEMFEKTDIYNSQFVNIMNFVQNNDMSDDALFAQLYDSIDMNNFMDYILAQIYYKNTDWPQNNVRIWRRHTDNKWRFILYDTDFGFDTPSNNTLTYLLNATDKFNNYCATHLAVVFKNMVKNQNFLNHFIDRFCIHISSTFEEERVIHVMDSLSAKIQTEIPYHQAKWGGNHAGTIATMKNFAAQRPAYMLGFLSKQYLGNAGTQTIQISSNINNATYTFNGEAIIDNQINLKSFKGRTVALQANAADGFKFKHWQIIGDNVATKTVFTNGSTWSYYDQGNLPDQNWNTNTYNTTSWTTGKAPFGYGDRFIDTIQTTISYGNVTTNRNVTAYFCRKFILTDLKNKENFQFALYVDDGAVVYLNGTEVGRYNMPTGQIEYNTFSTTYNNGDNTIMDIPTTLLREGENLVSVEIHQCDAKSSDMIFEMSMNYNLIDNNENIIATPVYTTTLNKDIQLKAIYEKTETDEPEKELSPQIFLNELVASNTVVSDEQGEKDDYIELYNAGDTAVNVGGWYLTDSELLPTMCQIPTNQPNITTMEPKTWLVLWADKQPEQGALHLNMKLGKTGEKIILSCSEKNGKILTVDSVTYPTLGDNQSYSRIPDGGKEWQIQNMTYNASNITSLSVENGMNNIIALYPCIVKDYIVLKNADRAMVQIYNIMGKLVLEQYCMDNPAIISMCQFSKGLYVVKVNDKTFKIIKL